MRKEECLLIPDRERRDLLRKLIEERKIKLEDLEPCIELAIKLGITPAIECSCQLIEKVTEKG
jgi:hypothetical protein